MIPIKSVGQGFNEEFNNAVLYGDFPKVKTLMSHDDALVNQKDKYGFTVLHNAVGEHYFEMIELLIKLGADVNASNDEGFTPLHLSAYSESAEILIKNGAKVDAESHRGETPLFITASEQGGFDVMKVLLENGASPMHKSKGGQTPIDVAKLADDLDKLALMKQYLNN